VYMRVVRFTDVDSERMESLRERINENDGPPEGIPSTGIQVLHDEGQGTAVVIQHFASAEDMEQGAKVLSEMDASETPGRRASVDTCELLVEMKVDA
jgi:hypothetical protein